MQQQQPESVFTQAYLCETRCLHQRGTVTAACHIEAPEDLLLGVCVCICVPLSVIAPVCRCKLHLCADGGVGELRCFGCKHFVCFCYVIEQHCFHTTAVEQIAISSALVGAPYQVSSKAGSNICLLQFVY